MNAITTLEGLNARRPVLSKAFDLVNPALYAKRLSEAYGIDAKGHWKDEISTLLTDVELAEAGVTIKDVEEAIEFYTATEAKVTRERIGGDAFVRYLKDEPGYLIISPGYRGGPAAG